MAAENIAARAHFDKRLTFDPLEACRRGSESAAAKPRSGASGFSPASPVGKLCVCRPLLLWVCSRCVMLKRYFTVRFSTSGAPVITLGWPLRIPFQTS